MSYPAFPKKHQGGQTAGQYADVPFDPSYFDEATTVLYADATQVMLSFAQQVMLGSLSTVGGGQVAIRPPVAVPQVVGPRFAFLMTSPGGRVIP